MHFCGAMQALQLDFAAPSARRVAARRTVQGFYVPAVSGSSPYHGSDTRPTELYYILYTTHSASIAMQVYSGVDQGLCRYLSAYLLWM